MRHVEKSSPWAPSVGRYLVRQSHRRLTNPSRQSPRARGTSPSLLHLLDPAAGRREECTSHDLAEGNSPSQQQQSFSSQGRRLETRGARLPAWRKGCQTTSSPTLQVSRVPPRAPQIKHPEVLIFMGKPEQFTGSMAPPHPSARTRGCVVKGSQVVAVGLGWQDDFPAQNPA